MKAIILAAGEGRRMLPQTKTSRSETSIDTSKVESLGWKQKETFRNI